MEEIFENKNYKNKEIPIEHLDYGYIGNCTDKNELYAILQLLKSGKEGRYEQLEEFTEKKIIEILPEKEKKRYIALTSNPTEEDIYEAENDLNNFLDDIKIKDNLVKNKNDKNIQSNDNNEKRMKLLKELGMENYESIPDVQKKIFGEKYFIFYIIEKKKKEMSILELEIMNKHYVIIHVVFY